MSKVIEKKYEIQYKPDKHIFLLKILDSYTKDDARIFFTDYDMESKKFEADDTSLVVDCSNLSYVDLEFESILENIIKLFMELHYKFRIFLKSKSPECDDTIKAVMNESGMVYGKDALFLDDMEAVNHLITM